jgi:glycerate-2-kinase
MFFKNFEQIVSNGQTSELKRKREDVLEILTAAIDAVNPYNAVKKVFDKDKLVFESEEIDLTSFENIYVVGFGKASVGMARAVYDITKISSGVVVTNDSEAKLENDYIDVVVAGHPIPNMGSINGAEKILDVVKLCGKNDLLIVLISGGGSALLCKPRVDLEDLQNTTDLLLRSGADINEINTIRKHLSYVKGGHLAKYAKGVVVSLVISDIVGDPLEFIASGPTCPDSTTFSDAKKVLEKYDLWMKIPTKVRNVIEDGVSGSIDETPKRDDPIFEYVFNYIVANNEIACNAAEEKAKKIGYQTMLLTTSLTGEARDIGRYLVDKADKYRKEEKDFVFISGGETTVTIKGNGRGGRNQELVLEAVGSIAEGDIVLASFATDGVDGKSDAAGAIADGFTLSRGEQKGLDPNDFLKENNSYEFFKELDDLFMTGPSGTNVMDIQVIIV